MQIRCDFSRAIYHHLSHNVCTVPDRSVVTTCSRWCTRPSVQGCQSRWDHAPSLPLMFWQISNPIPTGRGRLCPLYYYFLYFFRQIHWRWQHVRHDVRPLLTHTVNPISTRGTDYAHHITNSCIFLDRSAVTTCSRWCTRPTSPTTPPCPSTRTSPRPSPTPWTTRCRMTVWFRRVQKKHIQVRDQYCVSCC